MRPEEEKILKELDRISSNQYYAFYSRLDPALQTENVTYAVVQHEPVCLQLAPPETLTEWVIRKACSLDIHTFEYLNPSCLTEVMCLWGVDENPDSFLGIPCDKRTTAIYEKLLEKDALFYFKKFPQEVKEDPALVEKALQAEVENIHFIPPKLQIPDFYIAAALKHPYVITAFPPSLQREEVYTYFLKEDENHVVLGFIPPDLITRNMCQIVMEQFLKNPIALNPFLYTPYPDIIAGTLEKIEDPFLVKAIFSHLGAPRQKEEIVQVALEKNPECMEYLNRHFCTPEYCRKPLEENPGLLPLLVGERKTPDLSLIAWLKDPSIEKYIPLHIKRGKNIYSFARETWLPDSGNSLTYDEIKIRYKEHLKIGKTLNPDSSSSQKIKPDRKPKDKRKGFGL